MSFVAVYVKRNGISLHDVYGEQLEDGGSYWVHRRDGECFITKDGRSVGEAMAEDIDWEATRNNADIRDPYWRFLFADAKRDNQLFALHRKLDRARKVVEKCERRDYHATQAKLRRLGHKNPDNITEADYRTHEIIGEDHRKAKEQVEKLTNQIFDFHRTYCLSRRTPIALGVYGTS